MQYLKLTKSQRRLNTSRQWVYRRATEIQDARFVPRNTALKLAWREYRAMRRAKKASRAQKNKPKKGKSSLPSPEDFAKMIQSSWSEEFCAKQRACGASTNTSPATQPTPLSTSQPPQSPPAQSI